jgi:D-threo-aldose 1-dehydrogenase
MTTNSAPIDLSLRPFGPSEIQVSPLCIGCAPLGDMPQTFAYSVSEQQALEVLRAIFRSPINFLDTAASYGDGESERRIGIVLQELGGVPDGYVIATKADRDLQTGDFSGDQIKRSVERSLRLLGLDHLPIVYLHDPEHTTFENVMSPGGPVEVLLRLKDEGLIGVVGVAGGPIDLEMRYVATGAFEAVITHNRYTLLNRSAEPLLQMASQRRLAVLNAAPYGSGILAKGPDAYARYVYQDATQELVEQVRQIDRLCRRYEVPLAAAALQFSLRDPRVTSTIVGISKTERIQQTLELARHPIPNVLWDEINALTYSTEDPEAERWK